MSDFSGKADCAHAIKPGIGFGVFALARLYNNLWIAAVLFLILSAISISVYVVILRQIDDLAVEKRETLISELCRA